MNKKAIIAGLEMIINALNEVDTTSTDLPVQEADTATEAKPTKGKTSAKPTKELKEDTVPDLKGMSYNDLKSLCKKLGVSPVGSRSAIEKTLADYYSGETTNEVPQEEEAPATKSTKGAKAKSAPEPAEEETEEEEEEEASTYDLVAKATEDMSLEELADMLADVGVSGKGKREVLLTKIAKAVDDGLIELGDEDEDEEGEQSDEADEADETEEEAEEAEVEEMSPKRAKFRAKLVKDVSSGKISAKDINKYLSEISDEFSPDDYDDEEISTLYIDTRMSLVDDDGVEHEVEEPYEINGENYCCGEKLTYNKKKKIFVCSECGAEYDEE